MSTVSSHHYPPGHLGGPAAAVEEALPPAGPGGGGAQPALAAVIAVVDSGVAPGQTGVIIMSRVLVSAGAFSVIVKPQSWRRLV